MQRRRSIPALVESLDQRRMFSDVPVVYGTATVVPTPSAVAITVAREASQSVRSLVDDLKSPTAATLRLPATSTQVASAARKVVPRVSWGDIVDGIKDVGDAIKDFGEKIVDGVKWVIEKGREIYDKIKGAVGSFRTAFEKFKQALEALGEGVQKIVEVLAIVRPKAAAKLVDTVAPLVERGVPYRDVVFAGQRAAIRAGGVKALQAIRKALVVQREPTAGLVQTSEPTRWARYGNARVRTAEFRNAAGELFVSVRWMVRYQGKWHSSTTFHRVG